MGDCEPPSAGCFCLPAALRAAYGTSTTAQHAPIWQTKSIRSNGSVLTAVGINRYREAGAHCLYAPGPKDAETIATLVKEVDGPLNVVAGLSSTALSVTELENLGVRRISTGGSLARVCLAALRTSAAEIMTSGTFSFAGQAIPDAELSALFAKDRE